MRDEIGLLYQDDEFALLFPNCGQPAYSPWRLALVSVMQYEKPLRLSATLRAKISQTDKLPMRFEHE
jgi:transposase